MTEEQFGPFCTLCVLCRQLGIPCWEVDKKEKSEQHVVIVVRFTTLGGLGGSPALELFTGHALRG